MVLSLKETLVQRRAGVNMGLKLVLDVQYHEYAGNNLLFVCSVV